MREVLCERGVGTQTKGRPAVRFLHPASTADQYTFFMPLSTGKGGFFMQKKSRSSPSGDLKLFSSIKALCTAALLAAACVTISFICKFFTITPSLRVTFENIPLIISGYIFGPFVGLATGIIADITSTSASYGFGSINPILTLGAGSVGLTAGIISRYIIKKQSAFQIFVTVYASHIIGNMIIKSFGLYLYFATPLPEIIARIGLYILIALLESFIILAVFKSKAIKKSMGEFRK